MQYKMLFSTSPFLQMRRERKGGRQGGGERETETERDRDSKTLFYKDCMDWVAWIGSVKT